MYPFPWNRVPCNLSNAMRLCTLVGLFILGSGCNFHRQRYHPPGVIMITLDAARADYFSLYGHPQPTTPSIDRIASSSIVFDHAYTMAGYTLPSISSLWVGTHARNIVKGLNILLPTAETLPVLLHRHGIATAYMIANYAIMPERGYGRGVDYIHVFPWREPDRSPSPFAFQPLAMKWLRKQRKPYFLYMHLMQPHDPYLPPQRYAEIFGRPAPPRHLGHSSTIYNLRMGFIHPVPKTVSGVKQWYAANLRWADDAVGRLIDTLNREGFLNRAWLVITGDHGDAFGEHDIFYHFQGVYDENIHVPLIIHPPFRYRRYHGRVHAAVYMQDLFSTILDWFRLRPPTGVESQSLMPWIRNPNRPGRPHIISCNNQFRDCAILLGRTKIILHDDNRVELYHMPAERLPKDNLASRFPNQLDDLVRRFKVWRNTGRFESGFKGLSRGLAILKSLGYIGPAAATPSYTIVPGPLRPSDIRGSVSFSGWALDPRSLKPLAQFRISNHGSAIWPSEDYRNRDRVFIRFEQTPSTGKPYQVDANLPKDLHPGRSTIVQADWPGAPILKAHDVHVSVHQMGETLDVPLGHVLIPPTPPVTAFGSGWFITLFENRNGVKWMKQKAQLILYRPVTESRCIQIEAGVKTGFGTYHYRLLDGGDTVITKGIAEDRQWSNLSGKIHFQPSSTFAILDLVTREPAVAPIDREPNLIMPYPMTLILKNLHAQPCPTRPR